MNAPPRSLEASRINERLMVGMPLSTSPPDCANCAFSFGHSRRGLRCMHTQQLAQYKNANGDPCGMWSRF